MRGDKDTVSIRNRQEGFSLIEVVVVCMIIGIVLAFAIPTVSSSLRAYSLRNAAERLSERLAGGRALAMAKNKNVTVSIVPSTGVYGYDFSPVGAPDGTPDTSDPDDTTASYYVETLPAGITCTVTGGLALTNGSGIPYTSRGELPIGVTQVDIVLTNSGRSSTVSVNLRGQVWVH